MRAAMNGGEAMKFLAWAGVYLAVGFAVVLFMLYRDDGLKSSFLSFIDNARCFRREPSALLFNLGHVFLGSLAGPIMALGAGCLWIAGRVKLLWIAGRMRFRQVLHGMNGRRARRDW